MSIPLRPEDSQLFARLSRVEKVIVASQAKSITPGIILSPENGLLATNLTSSLCAFPVVAGSVFYSAPISIPTSTTRFIDTTQSDTSVDTVLQVRNTFLGVLCSDDAAPYGTKSKVKPLPSGSKFTIMVGSKAGTLPTSVIRAYINY